MNGVFVPIRFDQGLLIHLYPAQMDSAKVMKVAYFVYEIGLKTIR
jgi:hypothetical protein